MKKTGRILAFLSALAALAATPAMAQAASAVNLEGDVMVVKTTANDAGEDKVELVEPQVVVPGDRLIFRTNYKNVSADTVENFVVTNPLPSAVMLASDSDQTKNVSVDGGTTFGDLSELTVTEEDGSVRAAQTSDVTHLRWVLAQLEPGAVGQITFYAIVR